MHVERELKFAIDAGAAARAARVIPFAARPRRTRLESIYYDTPDLRLRRSGAAVRLRREGRRWLQALKLEQGAQGALAQRAEWEMPAPRGRLDCARFPREAIRAASGLDMVRIARRLRPLFATRFERRAGPLALGRGVRAVACIDRGTLEANGAKAPILEVELELQAGGIGPLIGLAESLVEPLGLRIEVASKAERGYRLAGGLKPQPARWSSPRVDGSAASDLLAALVSAALAQVAANAPRVGADPEYLHQLRVGVRRLRSALRAFRELLKRKRAKAIERPLRRMMQAFGAARDWDVFCETLADAESAPELLQRARRRRAAARVKARRLVATAQFQLTQLGVLRWLHGEPWKSEAAHAEGLARFARRALKHLHGGLLERAHGVDWHNAKRRHAVRIAVKRLRYGCDFFAACFPRRAVRPYLERLMSLQDTLGGLNDVAVGRKLLAQLGQPAVEAAPLRRWLAARERELIGSLEPAWEAFAAQRPFWQPKPRRREKR